MKLKSVSGTEPCTGTAVPLGLQMLHHRLKDSGMRNTIKIQFKTR